MYNSDRSRLHTNKIELKTINFTNEYDCINNIIIPPTIGPIRGVEELEFPLVDGEPVNKDAQYNNASIIVNNIITCNIR